MLQGAAQVAADGFNTNIIPKSVFFDGTNDYLSKTLGFTSDRKKAIIGVWLQRTRFATSDQSIFALKAGGSNGAPQFAISFTSSDDLDAFDYLSGSYQLNVRVDGRLFRDDSWFHFMASWDTAHTVSRDRFEIYINGDKVLLAVAASDGTFYSLNDNPSIANSDRDTVWMEGYHSSTSQKIACYCAQPFLLDGKSIQAGDVAISDILGTQSFGNNGLQIIPKATSGIATLANTAGAKSHVFSFEDSSALGNDASTNNNDFDLESIASGDQTTNTPSKTYPIWSALSNNLATSAISLSNGNRTIDDVNPAGVALNWWPQTGKWYFEAVGTTFGGSDVYLGIYEQTAVGKRVSAPWDETTGTHQWVPGTTSGTGGQAENNNTLTNYAGGAVTSNGTRIAFAYDMDNRFCYYGTISGSTITWKNSGVPTSGASGTGAAPFSLTSAMSLIPVHLTGGTDSQWTYYFESTAWAASAPNGYKECNTKNLTAPDYQGRDYFEATIYEGNGTNQRVGDFVPFTDVHTVDKSAMFQHDDARALSRTVGTPSSTGGKKGTWSVWFKTGLIDTDVVFFDSGTTATNRTSVQMDSNGLITFLHGSAAILKTAAGPTKLGGGFWQHLVIKADTSQGTASNRVKMYIDGTEITSFGTDARAASFAQDVELGYLDSGSTQFVGSYNGVSANQWDGYFAEVAFLDNQALDASSFGEVDTSTNRWVPKDISGLTYGNQGFYLEFEGDFGSSNGAGDSTGNSNNFTEVGTWAATDQFKDTPTKNYAILGFPIGNPVLSVGNLKLTGSGADYDRAYATLPVSKGKWYCEFKYVSGDDGAIFGIVRDDTRSTDSTSVYIGEKEHQYGLSFEAKAFNHAGELFDATNFDAADFGLLAFDIDNGKLFLGRRDVSGSTTIWYDSAGANNGNPATGANPTYTISNATAYSWRIGCHDYSSVIDANFGAGADFAVTIPSGFNELNQDNLDDTADLLTDFAWIKNRDTTDNHMLFDRIRDVNKDLHSNDTAAEVTNANTLTRFFQRGVQIGSDVEVNTVNESYALWQWLGGGTAATSSPAGTIASTVITSAPKHFSIVSYTGTGSAGTVGHGLGAAPEMILVKNRDQADHWGVYHKGVASDPETDYLILNATDTVADSNTFWNDTAPTVNVFSVHSASSVNASGEKYIAYCFRTVPGVCKVDSYIGNGNADGPLVITGFKPRWILIKWVSAGGLSAEGWVIKDVARDAFNQATEDLYANTTAAESTSTSHITDILGSGFKLRATGGSNNTSAAVYIYLAMGDIAGGGTLPPVYASSG
jgi:hypothetical protein